MFDILTKFSMLNNFGGGYSLTSIENESFFEIQCMQLCLVASAKAQEMASKKATAYSKEGLGWSI